MFVGTTHYAKREPPLDLSSYVIATKVGIRKLLGVFPPRGKIEMGALALPKGNAVHVTPESEQSPIA